MSNHVFLNSLFSSYGIAEGLAGTNGMFETVLVVTNRIAHVFLDRLETTDAYLYSREVLA